VAVGVDVAVAVLEGLGELLEVDEDEVDGAVDGPVGETDGEELVLLALKANPPVAKYAKTITDTTTRTISKETTKVFLEFPPGEGGGGGGG